MAAKSSCSLLAYLQLLPTTTVCLIFFASGTKIIASEMSQTLMYQNNIVNLVLEAFQTYEKTEPSFQKFALGVLIQLSANGTLFLFALLCTLTCF